MKRKEEIKKAAKACISGDTLSSKTIVFNFANGEGWVEEHINLESLWHDASEEPTEPAIILTIDEEGLTDVFPLENGGKFRFQGGFLPWKSIVFSYKLTKWAYISDLLPKGGKR